MFLIFYFGYFVLLQVLFIYLIIKYINMKGLVCFCLCVLFALFFSECHSFKKISNKEMALSSTIKPNSDILLGEGICLLKQFQGTSVDGKIYINWLSISNTSQFVFELEKSVDGKNYSSIYLVKGMVSPNENTALLNCYTDSTSQFKTVYYRLKTIKLNSTLKEENKIEFPIIMVEKGVNNKDYNLVSELPFR